MSRRKKSFFERLTGSINMDDEQTEYDRHYDDEYDDFAADEFADHAGDDMRELNNQWADDGYEAAADEFEDEGELAVDVYETPEHIVVQAMVAGVRPDALDVSITRERCTVSGRREAPSDASFDEYLHQELYWGSFSRSVTFPEEVEVEEAEANEDHGLLTIRLPKINKDRETKLEIKTS